MAHPVPQEPIGQDIDDMGGAVPVPQEAGTGLHARGGLALFPCCDPRQTRGEGGREPALLTGLDLEGEELAELSFKTDCLWVQQDALYLCHLRPSIEVIAVRMIPLVFRSL